MNKIGVDLIGVVNLFVKTERTIPIVEELWGNTNVKNETRSDSYYVHLLGQKILEIGQTSMAEFKFKFSDVDEFEIKLSKGEVLEMREGNRLIAEFTILEVVNVKLKR